jgi:4-amino-4-deoxy-L-arabinose transferase-like glycosyltransferase
MYSIIRFIQTEKNKWLYLFGISVGLGMMSKYSVVFITVSVLLGLLFTKYRTVLGNKHFWYASLLVLSFFFQIFCGSITAFSCNSSHAGIA